jgi:hypothetical protein
VVSVLGLLAAVGVVVATLTGRGDAAAAAERLLGGASDAAVSTSAWPWVTVAAAAVTGVAFAVVWVRAPRWPEMSARYDAPADQAQDAVSMSDADLWRAMDEGHDPTV